jgi:hypothetical protein
VLVPAKDVGRATLFPNCDCVNNLVPTLPIFAIAAHFAVFFNHDLLMFIVFLPSFYASIVNFRRLAKPLL